MIGLFNGCIPSNLGNGYTINCIFFIPISGKLKWRGNVSKSRMHTALLEIPAPIQMKSLYYKLYAYMSTMPILHREVMLKRHTENWGKFIGSGKAILSLGKEKIITLGVILEGDKEIRWMWTWGSQNNASVYILSQEDSEEPKHTQ